MKKFLNIFAALILAVVSTSCLKHDLEELDVYSGCDITRVDCAYRWKTGEIHPGTQSEKVNQVYVSADLFDYQKYHKSFYVVINGVITFIYVECFEIIDNYALIKSTDLKLEKGMYLYIYE